MTGNDSFNLTILLLTIAKTDIEMRCQLAAVGVTGAAVSSGFDIVLVDN
jgi:hypothetical protein